MPELNEQTPADEELRTIVIDRRSVIGGGGVLLAGCLGGAVLNAMSPQDTGVRELSGDAPAYDPNKVKLRFVVDTSKCIGCGLCVSACKEENEIPLEAAYNRTWVERHIETSDGELHIDSPDAGIHGFGPVTQAPGVESKDINAAYFVPRLCMQCENPPCVSVCPVSATYTTPEGVTLIDESRCIGCGYCVTACPYGARFILPAGEKTPLGRSGVADKCTWCYHRIARGLDPACVEVCPTDARRFGDAADPASPINAALNGDTEQLWPEYKTSPRVYYSGPFTEEA